MMPDFSISLIGLGAIGVPIAHKLSQKYPDQFYLILNERRKKKFDTRPTMINDQLFAPLICSTTNDVAKCADILIICVKNYDLESALTDIQDFVSEKTILLPLQNGIYAYTFFQKHFPQNAVLEGYVQGPNTVQRDGNFHYSNAGSMHIGSNDIKLKSAAECVFRYLRAADVDVYLEQDIRHMVWKKWMLNVAGNSITALTGADYSMFKYYDALQELCVNAMKEFLQVAKAEHVNLDYHDITDIMDYYISYDGCKKTSMLADVINKRKTENDYLAGMLLKIAEQHKLKLPVIETLYYLMETKENAYMGRIGCITMKNLFTEGIEYSKSLKRAMEDIDEKLNSKSFAQSVNSGNPEQ